MFVKIEEREYIREQHSELDDASKLLLKAAALIEQYGLWCGGEGSGRCVLTALIEAQGGGMSLNSGGYVAFDRFAQAIGSDHQSYELKSTQVYRWNDAQTKKIVVAKMRAVALGL